MKTETTVPTAKEPEVLTNRAAYLAAHPDARAVHEEHIRAILEANNQMVFGNLPAVIQLIREDPSLTEEQVKDLLARNLPAITVCRAMVLTSDKSRQAGEKLLQWAETLPGRKFTRDFYEQHQHEFVDARGQTIRFELLEWYIRVARGEKSPVDDLLTAWRCRQPMLVALGLEDEAERPPGKPVAPADPLHDMDELFDSATMTTALENFLKNERYCPNGKLRDDWKVMLAIKWKPAIETVDKVRALLGI